jgi:hypothetical protein
LRKWTARTKSRYSFDPPCRASPPGSLRLSISLHSIPTTWSGVRAAWVISVAPGDRLRYLFKQTLKQSGFVGYRANAIRWLVWTALLVCVTEIRGSSQQLGAQFHMALRGSAGGHVGTSGSIGMIAVRWDRRRQFPNARINPFLVTAGIRASNRLHPWDSIAPHERALILITQLAPSTLLLDPPPFPRGEAPQCFLP